MIHFYDLLVSRWRQRRWRWQWQGPLRRRAATKCVYAYIMRNSGYLLIFDFLWGIECTLHRIMETKMEEMYKFTFVLISTLDNLRCAHCVMAKSVVSISRFWCQKSFVRRKGHSTTISQFVFRMHRHWNENRLECVACGICIYIYNNNNYQEGEEKQIGKASRRWRRREWVNGSIRFIAWWRWWWWWRWSLFVA